MRLDATTLTDKKQICNFKHTEEKQNSLPSEKQNKFSLLWRHLKLKQNKKQLKVLFSLFPKTCSFPRLVHFLYCTYCVHTMWNKGFMKMPNMFSHFMKLLIGPKVSRFAAKSFMKVNSVNLGCWIKSNFVSITWVLHFILKRSYFHETFVKRDWFSVCNKQRFYHFTQHWPVLLYLMYFKTLCRTELSISIWRCLGRNYCADGTCVPPRIATIHRLSPLPRKDTNHLSCLVLCFIKCLPRETAISFWLPHCQRGFSKTKTHQKQNGFKETRCNNMTDKKTNLQF
jgi:hypothetical protein